MPETPRTPKQRRERRRALRTWIPISIVALICVAVAAGASIMQNSWWSQPDPPASSDQRASDGASRFDRAGVDYLTRDGIARIKLNDDAVPATELGLDADGERVVELLVPVTIVVVGVDGAFVFDLVRNLTLTTSADRVVSVAFEPGASGTWQVVEAELTERAAAWGWTDADLADLETALGDAAPDDPVDGYAAELPTLTVSGVQVSARVEVEGGRVGLRYTLSG